MAVVHEKIIRLNLLIRIIEEGQYETILEYLQQKKIFIEGLLKAIDEMKDGLKSDKEVDTEKTISELINKDSEYD